jgi:hypothetical protein
MFNAGSGTAMPEKVSDRLKVCASHLICQEQFATERLSILEPFKGFGVPSKQPGGECLHVRQEFRPQQGGKAEPQVMNL